MTGVICRVALKYFWKVEKDRQGFLTKIGTLPSIRETHEEMIKNQYINSLATWTWGSDPSPLVTPTTCLNSLPFLPTPCLARIIAKSIGIGIILASCVNKAPILRNILLSRGTVVGLSTVAIYGEIILYSNAAFYNVLRGNPFSAYGETLTVLLQSMIIVVLLWRYESGKNNALGRCRWLRNDVVSALVAYGAYLFGVFYVLTPATHYVLMVYNPLVLLSSRGTQIYKNYKSKQTGSAQSAITMTMNLVGSLVRIGTTINEIGFDLHILRSYGTSVLCNSILLGQILLYRTNTEAYLAKLKNVKDE